MRPVSYSQELVDQCYEYIDAFESHGHVIPSLVGLCEVINRSRSSIYGWVADTENPFNDQFLDITNNLNEKQELVAFQKGLTKEHDSGLTKLLLGKHGYHDKQDNTLGNPDGSNILSMDEINARLAALASKSE
jgi:hypothetical protein